MSPGETLRCGGNIVHVWVEVRGKVLGKHEMWEYWRGAEWWSIKVSLGRREEEAMRRNTERKWWRRPAKEESSHTYSIYMIYSTEQCYTFLCN